MFFAPMLSPLFIIRSSAPFSILSTLSTVVLPPGMFLARVFHLSSKGKGNLLFGGGLIFCCGFYLKRGPFLALCAFLFCQMFQMRVRPPSALVGSWGVRKPAHPSRIFIQTPHCFLVVPRSTNFRSARSPNQNLTCFIDWVFPCSFVIFGSSAPVVSLFRACGTAQRKLS